MNTTYIKTWPINDLNRKKIVSMSPTVRYNTEDRANGYIQLKSLGLDHTRKNVYDTGDNNTIKVWSTEPMALIKWLMFEAVFSTTENNFREYSLVLSNKVGNIFDYSESTHLPEVGEKVFQGDHQTTVDAITLDKITLADGTNFLDGRAYVKRSQCELYFQIFNDNNPYFYNVNTSQWEIAGANDWNTTFQLSNNLPNLNISTFGKKIGFNIKLKTNDKYNTPLLNELKLLGEYQIDFARDIIYDSLFKAIKDNIDVATQISIILESSTNIIDLANDYVLENSGYNFVDGVSVYNITDDPMKLTNLFDHYEVGTPRNDGTYNDGKVYLTSAQSAGKLIQITLKYIPELAINTNLDYYEVNRWPSIVFEKVIKENTIVAENSNLGEEYIRNKLTAMGIKHYSPSVNDLVFEYAAYTGNQFDQHNLGEALQRLFNSLHYIYSWGLDLPYPIVVRDIFRSSNVPNLSNINTHEGSFVIKNVMTQIRSPFDVPLIDYLNRNMTTN